MVRNSEKRKLRKDREFKELDIQLNKGFFCGSCSQGFVTLEVCGIPFLDVLKNFIFKI